MDTVSKMLGQVLDELPVAGATEEIVQVLRSTGALAEQDDGSWQVVSRPDADFALAFATGLLERRARQALSGVDVDAAAMYGDDYDTADLGGLVPFVVKSEAGLVARAKVLEVGLDAAWRALRLVELMATSKLTLALAHLDPHQAAHVLRRFAPCAQPFRDKVWELLGHDGFDLEADALDALLPPQTPLSAGATGAATAAAGAAGVDSAAAAEAVVAKWWRGFLGQLLNQPGPVVKLAEFVGKSKVRSLLDAVLRGGVRAKDQIVVIDKSRRKLLGARATCAVAALEFAGVARIAATRPAGAAADASKRGLSARVLVVKQPVPIEPEARMLFGNALAAVAGVSVVPPGVRERDDSREIRRGNSEFSYHSECSYRRPSTRAPSWRRRAARRPSSRPTGGPCRRNTSPCSATWRRRPRATSRGWRS